MIIVLTGPGEVSKRSYFLKIKKQSDPSNISLIDLKQDPLSKLITLTASISLFETEKRLIIVENSNDNLDLNQLSRENITILFVCSSIKLGSIFEKSAKQLSAEILNFEGEKELTAFPFLDALIEKKKQVFLELNKLLKEYGGIYLLTMIEYLLRRNILPLPTSSFAKDKIKHQRLTYQTNSWPKLYKLTLETEFKIKSGLINEDLGLTFLVAQWVLGKYGV